MYLVDSLRINGIDSSIPSVPKGTVPIGHIMNLAFGGCPLRARLKIYTKTCTMLTVHQFGFSRRSRCSAGTCCWTPDGRRRSARARRLCEPAPPCPGIAADRPGIPADCSGRTATVLVRRDPLRRPPGRPVDTAASGPVSDLLYPFVDLKGLLRVWCCDSTQTAYEYSLSLSKFLYW